jgi:hypothetical protein
MGRAIGNIVWTAIVSLIVIVVGTIFRLEIEDFWNGRAQRFIESNIGTWATATLEYLGTFAGGVLATLLILLAVDRARNWLGRHKLKRPNDQQTHGVRTSDGGEILARPELPRRELPRAETDAISACAIEIMDLLQNKSPSLVKRANEIIGRWERGKLTYATRRDFEVKLGELSEAIHAIGRSLQELKAKNVRLRDQGFAFIFNEGQVRGDFQQAIARYANAIRELVERQPAEILRLHNENLSNNAFKFETWTNDATRKLMHISKDPSQFY